MTITAKFQSKCSVCRCDIFPGQRVEWTKGQPVRHPTCQVGTTFGPQGSAPKSTAPRSNPRANRYSGECCCGAYVAAGAGAWGWCEGDGMCSNMSHFDGGNFPICKKCSSHSH